ncbi:TolC family protein [Chitinophaga arvensicola]|uniref:Outer membrane protein TolC n=1 Tax=Chitinophaga arvensicola TaxID=29529 RepID=A0A1I0P079_9BACT|nr:TolC family protein [Chitinophaga arvensicola]SEW07406.1 Outer membrane protein TolC [Chitinophaga arvensicola]
MNIWKPLCLLVIAGCSSAVVMGQTRPLTLQDALETGLKNYQSIKAKENYAKAANANISAVRREYLPDLNLAAQNSYGTVNGENGPMWGYKGWTTGASGPVLPSQNWNAAFGGLYLANISWDVVTFGRQHAKVQAAKEQLYTNQADLEQEKFEQQVRVAGAYLNLLAAQRLRGSMESNLKRAEDLKQIIVSRALNGLTAGVDSSIANAEVSKAKLTLVDAVNYENSQSNKLAEMMDVPPQDFILDTTFITKIPNQLLETISAQDSLSLKNQPLLKLFSSRVTLSDANERLTSKNAMPRLSFMGVMQTRGSGFDNDYSAANLSHYSQAYWSGVKPQISNYLVGLNLSWTVTDIWRTHSQVTRQHYTTEGLKNEYNQTYNRLQHQLQLSEQQIDNAVKKYREAPIGLKAASDAFLQKSTLYENGLSNIADLAQALYNINRAETDRDIAYNGVWQAILYKSATVGDLQLFLNQL